MAKASGAAVASTQSQRAAGSPHAGELWHLELLDTVVPRHGWTDGQFAQTLGVKPDCIPRWRSFGVPNCYVPALRSLRETAGE
jgi:hypothetical protein